LISQDLELVRILEQVLKININLQQSQTMRSFSSLIYKYDLLFVMMSSPRPLEKEKIDFFIVFRSITNLFSTIHAHSYQ